MKDVFRLSFILCSAALLQPSAASGADGDGRVMRVGLVTDTHIGATAESRSGSRLRLALELFREKGCDIIINLGDIAEAFDPVSYATYRRVTEEVFSGTAHPREIFVYAWHDAKNFEGCPRDRIPEASLKAFPEVKRLLGATNDSVDRIDFRGYAFLVVPQFFDFPGNIGVAEYERRIAAACADSPGRPVFVLDHIPTGGLLGCRYPERDQVLTNFPQVVYLCGHTHASLRNDLLIRQDAFTTVNAGCLATWGPRTVGHAEPRHESYGVLTMDVYADRLDFRRWDVRDRSEIVTWRPWTVPLPFVAATAPWRPEACRAEAPVPDFPAGAKLAVTAGDPFDGFHLRFPSAGPFAHKYRIAAQVVDRDRDCAWREFTWREALGDWDLRPAERKDAVEHLFEACHFPPRARLRFTVVPQNAYGVQGRTQLVSDPISVPRRKPAADETAEIQSRIDRASANGGGTVALSAGCHETGGLFLRSGVTLRLEKGAVLKGVADRARYPDYRLPFTEMGEKPWCALVTATGAVDVAIVGEGEIFGNGAAFPYVRDHVRRPRGLVFHRCRGVRIEGVKLRDFANWSCYFKACDGVAVRGVTVDSHANYNNDGFDVDSRNVLIENCRIDSGDDAICLKSDDPGFAVEDVEVRKCVVASRCNALKIGTGSHGTFRRIRFTDCETRLCGRVFIPPGRTERELVEEFASWIPGFRDLRSSSSAIAVENVDGGLVEDVEFRNIVVEGSRVPVFIRLGARTHRSCGIPCGTVGRMRRVLIENVRGTAIGTTGCSITGAGGRRPEDITLRNVRLAFPGGGTEEDASWRVPDLAERYPDASMFLHNLPAWGFFVRNADGVTFDGVTLATQSEDRRAAVVSEDVGWSRSDYSVGSGGAGDAHAGF